MAFTLPDDLAPELYPLAWLTGTWRGYGILTYGETVPEQAVYQEMTFDHDGGPYLRQTTTIWTVDATRSKNLDFEMPGLQGASLLAPAQIWSTETTYWRPVGQEQPDGADAETDTAATEPAQDGTDTTDTTDTTNAADTKGSGGPLIPVTQLELVSADPAGHVAVWEGWIQGPRAQVGTQAVGRARTAVPVEEMTRMFGLVGGDLMWTQDMAAFGRSEVTTYASGRLGRVEDVNDPAAQPGSALDPAEPEGESSTSSDAASDDAEPTA